MELSKIPIGSYIKTKPGFYQTVLRRVKHGWLVVERQDTSFNSWADVGSIDTNMPAENCWVIYEPKQVKFMNLYEKLQDI